MATSRLSIYICFEDAQVSVHFNHLTNKQLSLQALTVKHTDYVHGNT